MDTEAPANIVPLSTKVPVWGHVFMVSPLVIVGSRSASGEHDLAPKHMAMPLGWSNHYCFVCSPRHTTYANIAATGAFTVSFPRPEQIVQTSLAAAPREADSTKPSLAALPTFPARVVEGVLVAGCSLVLECRLERILDGFGENSLVIGEVVAASADERALRVSGEDEGDLLHEHPMLAFLSPGRFAAVAETFSFPYPVDFKL
jgi:flavin reductase (DIM6/NTAB) family NADH-FMN oxidoreductase RutF